VPPSIINGNKKLAVQLNALSGNTNRGGRLSTVDLLIKVAYFVKTLIFST
jgi:hypothetical protein